MAKKTTRPGGRSSTIAASLTALLAALAGLAGLATFIEALNGPQPVPEACTVYWNDIRELKNNGFTGFGLMDGDSELSDRCGTPSKVAASWPDK